MRVFAINDDADTKLTNWHRRKTSRPLKYHSSATNLPTNNHASKSSMEFEAAAPKSH
jgi:hypothetical protein